MGWQNRIIESGHEAPEQLLANPANWRIHPKHQQDALSAVLDEVGWVDDVIVNRRTNHVLDGHLRVSLAISREEPKIPVKYVDLSEAEERLVLAVFDPIAAMAGADKEKLEDLLKGIESETDEMRSLVEQVAKDTKVDLNDAMADKSLSKWEMCSECGQRVKLE